MRLRHIPIIGLFLKYLNLYAGQGNPRYLFRRAPLRLLLDRFCVEFAINVLFVALIFCLVGESRRELEFTGLVVSVFPSLLGFGIGVFALIFVLPDDFLSSLDKRSGSSGIASTLLVADMAFPLLYLAFGLAASALMAELWTNTWGQAAQLVIFLYGLTLMCDLISGIATAAFALRHSKSQHANIVTGNSDVLKGLRRRNRR